MSKSKNVLFIMTGSIACYKACGVISSLHQKGYPVKVVMSPASLQFVGASTIEGLTGETPITDMYAAGSVMDHIHLVRWADLTLVAPATANYINKVAHGLGDDLLTTLFLAHDFKKPFLIAPAMNTKMYLHPTVQHSLNQLKGMGVEILETASGVLACGEVGYGRLLDPVLIVEEVQKRLGQDGTSAPRVENSVEMSTTSSSQPSARALKVLITSGGTSEPIDDVRVITNKSTGRTAAYLAQQLANSGVEVYYLHAQSAAVPEAECFKRSFVTFNDLEKELTDLLSQNHFDAVIHAAAVSDYSVVPHEGKISSEQDEVLLKLKKNKKLISEIKKLNPKTMLIGFKLTSTSDPTVVSAKVQSLFTKAHCDYVVHNDWSEIQKNNHTFNLYQPDLNFEPVGNVQNLSFQLFNKLSKARSL